MNDRTFDQLLAAWIEQGPTVAPDRVSVEARREIRRTRQSAALGPWMARRFANMSTFAKVGVAAAIVIIIAVLGISLLIAPNVGNPGPTPTPSWSGPVRTDLGGAVVAHTSEADGSASWTDPGDAAMGWVDITRVLFADVNAGNWNIGLADWPPPATGPDGGDLIVAHGLVLDTTGDGVADYVVGVENDPTLPGEFRAWVTNLATGATSEQIGPPYGVPVEFGHYTEGDFQGPGAQGPMVGLTFLPGTEPADFDIETLRYYVWASATEAGEVVAWDYAPDAAWLGPPPTVPDPTPEPSFSSLPDLGLPGSSPNEPAGEYGWTGDVGSKTAMHHLAADGSSGETQLVFAVEDDCFASWEGPEPEPFTDPDGWYLQPYDVPGVTFHPGDREPGETTAIYALTVEERMLCVYITWDGSTTEDEVNAARSVVGTIRALTFGQGIRITFTLPEGWATA